MTANGFWRLIKRISDVVGLPGPAVSPHVFRHTFATDLMAGGADLRVLQLLMGHESIKTTSVYLRTSKQQLKKVHAKHHPRG
jgi:integrase/recombinase XerD